MSSWLSSNDDNNSMIMYNEAATLSSIVIMAVPLYYVKRAFFGHTSNTKTNLQLQLYSLSQTLLFVGNLYGHWTGYLGPPCMDTLGCVNNVFLATVIYRVRYHDNLHHYHHQQQLSKQTKMAVVLPLFLLQVWTPTMVTMLMTGLGLTMLGIGLFVSKEAETYLTQRVTPPVSLYVVVMMGRVAYYHQQQQVLVLIASKDKKKKNNYYDGGCMRLYWFCVALLLMVVASTETERYLCDVFSDYGKRAYHSIVLHFLICSLFGCLSELAFQITTH
jgi:hypothetical protein